MPIAERLFELVKNLSLEDFLELATFLPVLIRARLAGVDLSFRDVQHFSLSGLHRESARTGRLTAPIPIPEIPERTRNQRATRDGATHNSTPFIGVK